MTSKAMGAQRRAGDPWPTTLGLWLVLLWGGPLAGLLAGPLAVRWGASGASAAQPGAQPAAQPAAGAWCDFRAPAAVPLSEASPRQLRALPGIGQGRARALVEAGQRRGAALGLADWGALPGLGPQTLAEVRRHLEAREP